MVINTEAHIFPRFKLARGLKTGWERAPRDAEGKVKQLPTTAAAAQASPTTTTQVVKVEMASPQPTTEIAGTQEHQLA